MINHLRSIYWKLSSLPLIGRLAINYAPLIQKYALKIVNRKNSLKYMESVERERLEDRLRKNLSLSKDMDYRTKCIKISVIINTCDRGNYLEAAIQSVLAQYYPNFELICVNGPSLDNTQLILDSYKNKIVILSCPEKNLSMSRNMGIAAAKGEIIAFIDDDAQAAPDWLMELARHYNEKTVGAVGGFVHDKTGIGWQARVCVANRFGEVNYYNEVEDSIKAEGSVDTWGSKKYFSPIGVNISFNRKALLEVGGFDENFFWHLDETDVLIRLNDKGYKIKYARDAEVTHQFAENSYRNVERIPTSFYHQARSKTYFILKHAVPVFGKSKSEKRIFAYLEWLKSLAWEGCRLGKINHAQLQCLLDETETGKKSAYESFYKNNE